MKQITEFKVNIKKEKKINKNEIMKRVETW